jgi:MurNAc alpha-1-phosphate uridylyltransferase
MRPLTDNTPKPLLTVCGVTLIEHLLTKLKISGFTDIVINLSYLGEQIAAKLGNGHDKGVNIKYSWESPDPLDTGGGICKALPLLGTEPFLLVNGDIWTDYPFYRLSFEPAGLAHLILVDNPAYSPAGDFFLNDRYVYNSGKEMLTYGCISVLRPELFSNCHKGSFPLAPLIRKACDLNQASGEYFNGCWHNIGTPEQLRQLNIKLAISYA